MQTMPHNSPVTLDFDAKYFGEIAMDQGRQMQVG